MSFQKALLFESGFVLFKNTTLAQETLLARKCLMKKLAK